MSVLHLARRVRNGLLAGLAGSLLLPLLAQAQQLPDTASFTLSNAKLQNLGAAEVKRPHRLVLLNVTPAGRGQTQVQQYWCDERLRVRRTARLVLPGKLELAAAGGSAHHLLLQLLSRDSLVLASVDTLGYLAAQVRQPLTGRRRLLSVSDIGLSAADAFITIEQQRESTCRLVCRDAGLRVRWEKTFGPAPEATLTNWAADATHLWVVLMADYNKRHPLSTAVCLDLASGQELSRVDLTSEKARRVPSVAEMGPGHTLLLAGHAFDGEAAVRRRSGDLFFQRLGPDGQIQADYLTDFEQQPELHGAAAERVQWQLLWPAGQQVRLVGETYTSTSAGEQLAASALTAGILGGATVLRPKDVVTLALSSAGQVTQLRVVPLPLDKGEFSHPNYWQGRIMARMAMEAGAFRSRGLTLDSTALVLRSPQRIQLLHLPTGQLQLLRPAPDKGTADVMYAGQDFIIIGEARQRSLRLLRLPLPAAR